MLRMRNIFVISVFLCLSAVFAAAQDLDQTVEVSREYEGKLVEVHKPAIKMAVPDSVTRFALDFDYSVFENPYKGSYEFNPYLLNMKPSASDSGESTFYLRAGAGYQLHPTLDLVWSPKVSKKNSFNMDVYAAHRSFVGNYLTISPDFSSPENVVMTRIPKNEEGTHKWFGYDLLSKAGVAAKADFEKIALDFDAGYYGLVQQDREWLRDYNAVDAGFGISSKPETVGSMVFDLDVAYRFGQDRIESKLTENLVNLDFNIGPFFKGDHHLSFDFGSDLAFYSGAFSKTAGEVHLVPRYVFRKNNLDVNVGLRISKLLESGHKEQYVYPDVNVSYNIIPMAMKVYFNAGGGNRFDSYSSLIAQNHHITHQMLPSQLGYTIERVSVMAGFDGRITENFSYNLCGGYVNYANMMTYGLELVQSPRAFVTYAECQKWFAALDWALDVEGFRFDGTVSYGHYFGSKGVFENGYGSTAVLRPAALTGDVAVEYNWKKRIMAGVDCEFSTGRTGGVSFAEPGTDLIPIRDAVIPGYADLGIYAEYATARNLSFWLRAGNLLNMAIQRNPLYAEKGVYCTVGICLNL